MSKIGKKPIAIPVGAEVKITDGRIDFKGKEGALSLPLLPHLKAEIKTSADNNSNELLFSATGTFKQARANWGTMAALAKNAILGVSQGFSKTLEIEGIGFKASVSGDKLILNVGFTHPINFTSPAGVKVSVEKNRIKISGINKEAVGQTAAAIRAIKKPEPYKGKGIHYLGEVIRRKAGKKVVGATAA